MTTRILMPIMSIAVPILILSGRCAGMLAIRHSEPVQDVEMVEHILHIMASRIAVEFERLHIERDHQDQNMILKEEVEHRPDEHAETSDTPRDSGDHQPVSCENLPVGVFQIDIRRANRIGESNLDRDDGV